MEIPVLSHAAAEPSAWVARWAREIHPAGTVLDLACGSGRHASWLAARGHPVLAVDIDCSRLPSHPLIQPLQADLEAEAWPLAGRVFDAVVVTNYLYRPHFQHLLEQVAPGGLLIYETFAQGNERFGRPRNPDHLLAPGELRERTRNGFIELGFEEGEFQAPRPAVIQRICARRKLA